MTWARKKAHTQNLFSQKVRASMAPSKKRTMVRQEKEHKPNFWVQISSCGVGVFHVKGWGPKRSVWKLNFLAGYPGIFAGISWVCTRKAWEKRVCVQFLSPAWIANPEGPKIKKIRDFDRHWKFRARMKFSSEPPTAALFFVGKSRRRDWNFRARSKISIEIKNFDRDQIFLIVGPSGNSSESYIWTLPFKNTMHIFPHLLCAGVCPKCLQAAIFHYQKCQVAERLQNAACKRPPHSQFLNPRPIWLDDRGAGQWKWMEEVPCRTPLTPLASPCFVLIWKGGNRRALTLRGEGGDHFHCTVEPSPGHIRCRFKTVTWHRRPPQKGSIEPQNGPKKVLQNPCERDFRTTDRVLSNLSHRTPPF